MVCCFERIFSGSKPKEGKAVVDLQRKKGKETALLLLKVGEVGIFRCSCMQHQVSPFLSFFMSELVQGCLLAFENGFCFSWTSHVEAHSYPSSGTRCRPRLQEVREQRLGQNSLSSPELLMESSFPGHKYHPNPRTLKFLKLITVFFP